MPVTRRRLLETGLPVAAFTTLAARSAAAPSVRPEVFGHRGACALRPEHTLASYALAIADGADFVEPDLVATRDGVLVCRHENNIAETTDVAARQQFAGRRTTKVVDGQKVTGWFTEDFTLAELKTLRAIERLPKVRPQNRRYDGEFEVPTFAEYLDFVAAEAAARGRIVGLVPEIKHSTYFAHLGLPLEERLIQTLNAHPYARRAPVVIQSFETANLRELRRRLGRPQGVRLMQLIDDPAAIPADVAAAGARTSYAELMTPQGLAGIAEYADILAPNTRALIPLDAQGRLAAPGPVIADAHRAGLKVMPWTFRPENQFLAADFRDGSGETARNPAGSVAEIRRYLAAGIDGFFTDDPALGRQAVDA